MAVQAASLAVQAASLAVQAASLAVQVASLAVLAWEDTFQVSLVVVRTFARASADFDSLAVLEWAVQLKAVSQHSFVCRRSYK